MPILVACRCTYNFFIVTYLFIDTSERKMAAQLDELDGVNVTVLERDCTRPDLFGDIQPS